MSRKPVLVANWKLYKTQAEAQAFCQALPTLLQGVDFNALELGIASSFTLIATVAASLKQANLPSLQLAAQNMAQAAEGAYTGEVSFAQLQELGVSQVIIGHSERRAMYGETDALVAQKTKLALDQNLTPVVCVGESLETREAGNTDALVEQQVKAAIQGLNADEISKVVFAYEPIWAIGTGKVCEAAEANRVCGLIRQWAGQEATRVLYGGSVKPDNIDGLMAESDIDGGLVGGASLQPESFAQLAKGIQAARLARV